MKPDWKEAPVWANYLAMDQNGDWFWYEGEPWAGVICWHGEGRHALARDTDDWANSKEARP